MNKPLDSTAELPPPDYVAGTKGMLCEDAWARETVEAYGQACAEAARQPAPVVSNDLRNAAQLIMDLYDDMRMGKESIPAFNALRTALAATAAPVLSDEQAWKLIEKALGYADTQKGGTMLIQFTEDAGAIARAILATRSQP